MVTINWDCLDDEDDCAIGDWGACPCCGVIYEKKMDIDHKGYSICDDMASDYECECGNFFCENCVDRAQNDISGERDCDFSLDCGYCGCELRQIIIDERNHLLSLWGADDHCFVGSAGEVECIKCNTSVVFFIDEDFNIKSDGNLFLCVRHNRKILCLCGGSLRLSTLEEEKKTRKELYAEYLESDVWKAKREMAIAHYGKMCVLCGNTRINIHHRKYPAVWGEETVDMLIVLCRECHKKFHGILED